MAVSSAPTERGLHLAFCSHEAARYAVTRWHYSRSLPASKLVKVGVWEGRAFIGVVIFSRGAAHNIGRPFGLKQTECVELTRVALREHRAPVSRIMAVAVRLLQASSPGLKLLVSYADPAQGHHGGIYQATNWLYLGEVPMRWLRFKGDLVHPKTLYSKFGTQSVAALRRHDPNVAWVEVPPKHKYVLPLEPHLRTSLEPRSLPYPKRVNT